MKNITKQLLRYIPGGAHTYSRGFDQFPSNAPAILSRGKDAYVYDQNGKKFLDYGMGLRSINIGYNNKIISRAAIKEIFKGNNLTLPSTTELKAAKLFTNIIETADMVKFAKNGSTAVTAAIKLARAYTGKEIVLRCSDHPFFSYDDWFISSTPVTKGIPKNVLKNIKNFKYKSINELNDLIKKYKNNIAALILEPATTECPYILPNNIECCGKFNCKYKKNDNFLKIVENICKKNKIIFILDEMITGFRWSLYGAQKIYSVKPDLSTFGKAMANGFSISALCGKRKIMKLGSIENKGKERVFLVSTTFGSEMMSLGAFIETIKFIKKHNVIKKNWIYGQKLKDTFNKLADKYNINEMVSMKGPSCSPYYVCKDMNKDISLPYKTLFMQEMIKNGVLFTPYISISYSHGSKELKITEKALSNTMLIYKKALKFGIKRYLKGDSIKPVFRKYN